MNLRPIHLFLSSTLLLAACGSPTGTVSDTSSSASSSTVAESSAASSLSAEPVRVEDHGALRTYANEYHRYRISFPNTATLPPPTENADLTIVPQIPEAIAAGTTLTETKVDVFALEGSCPVQSSVSSTQTLSGIPFGVSAQTGAAAGNLYDTTTYQAAANGYCYQIVALIHSCNLGPDCGEGHDQPFDREAVFAELNTIVRSFQLTQ